MIIAKNLWEQRVLVSAKTTADVDAELVRVKAHRDPTPRKPARIEFLNKLRASIAGRKK